MTHALGIADSALSGQSADYYRAGFYEETPELSFPNNLVIYDRMRRSDPEIRSMLRAVSLPVFAAKPRIAGSDVSPGRLEFAERELGVVEDEKGRRRGIKGGVSWDDLIRHILIHLPLGFMPLERWYEIGASDVDGVPGQVGHLHLAPRMPRTVVGFDLNPDGTCKAIRQTPYTAPGVTFHQGAIDSLTNQIVVPRDRLALFVNEQEGSDFSGNAVLRSVFKHWLVKDTLIRIGALAADRQGMGVPVVSYPGGGEDDRAQKAQALQIATQLRAGEESGVAVPQGWQVSILGVSGSVAEALAWVKYHDESISRSMLAMFLNLGHDAALGSGQTMTASVDYFLLAEKALLRYIEEVVTEDILRPLFADNFGVDEPYPTLTLEDPAPEDSATSEALGTLVTAGLIVPDEPLRGFIRERYKLPEAQPDQPQLGPDGLPVADPNAPPLTSPKLNPGGSAPPGGPPAVTGGLPPGQTSPGLPRRAGGLTAVAAAGVDRLGQPLWAGAPVGVLDRGAVRDGTLTGPDPAGGLTVAFADGDDLVCPVESVELAPGALPPEPAAPGLAERAAAAAATIAALTPAV